MDPIMELARKHNILVLEDAAHAFGAMYKGKKIGTIGDFAAFSFHEVKNITSFGEGGIATTTVPGFKDHMKAQSVLGDRYYIYPNSSWYGVYVCRGRSVR